MFVASALVIGLQTANFARIWFSEYNFRSVIGSTYWRRGHLALFALYALILLLISIIFGALSVGYLRVLDVILSQIFSVLVTNFVAYIQLALIGRWKFLTHIGPMLRLTGENLIIVLLWILFTRWIYAIVYPPRHTLLVYDEQTPDQMLQTLSSCNNKYVVSRTIPLSAGIDQIRGEAEAYECVVLGDLPAHERNLLVKYCFEKNIRCYCLPKISDIMIMSSEKVHMFDTPLLLMRNRGLSAEQQFVKRFFDIVLSAAALVLLSPLLLIIALCVHLYDGGPVFYRQQRLTKDGRVFSLIKFRSMRVDSEEKGARLAMREDDRVTPVGRVLRNIHFDELPQLINILRGDMSIVGPRPERPEIAAEYEKAFPEFAYRLKVPAGLTGYAQVYGKYNTTPYDKLKLDLTYIETYTFWLDIRLIATTIKILFQKENTEGVEQWQRTALEERSAGSRGGADVEPGEISVIIPCHNAAATLPAALDSCLKQRHVLEILVIDDCSDDESESVIRAYAQRDSRIRCVRNETNLGASGSRNKGVEMASGRLIAFLDADDIWADDKLHRQMRLMQVRGSVLCCTGRELMKEDGTLTGRAIGVTPTISYRDLLLCNTISCSSVLVTREAILAHPMEHEDSHEDYITWLKILRDCGDACGINEPLLYYRVSASGKSGGKLKSARMTWKVYRYMGFGPVRSAFCFICYACYGLARHFL